MTVASIMTYRFSTDWFTDHIPAFEKFLGELRGQPCRLLELGSYEGRCTIWLNDNIATHSEARVESVDHKVRPNFAANRALAPWDRIIVHHGMSFDIMRSLPLATYDFVYVDACHFTVNVLEDAVLGFRLLKVGGIMAFDDYVLDDAWRYIQGTPAPAIDAFLSIYHREIELLHRDEQVFIKKTIERRGYDGTGMAWC